MEKEAIQLLKDFYDHGNPKGKIILFILRIFFSESELDVDSYYYSLFIILMIIISSSC